MSRSSPASSTGRQSWREPRRVGSGAPVGRSFARWFVSLTALVLACLLAFGLMQGCQPSNSTYVWMVPFEYGQGVTAIRYGQQADADYLAAAIAPDERFLHMGERVKWKSLQESGSTGQLAANLELFPVTDQDCVIGYLSAHGISADGKAYLLCSDLDFERPDGLQARYPIDELLATYAAVPAKTKLLILDWGRVQFDVRLGVAYNEFPELLEQTVRELNDPNLWVLVSHSDIVPPTAYAEHYSLFSRSVADGLAGEADRHPSDKDVSLAELYSYVVARAESWFQPEGKYAYRPMLLRGATGVVTNLADAATVPLVYVPAKKSADKEEQADDKPTEQDKAIEREKEQAKGNARARLSSQRGVSAARSAADRASRLANRVGAVLPGASSAESPANGGGGAENGQAENTPAGGNSAESRGEGAAAAGSAAAADDPAASGAAAEAQTAGAASPGGPAGAAAPTDPQLDVLDVAPAQQAAFAQLLADTQIKPNDLPAEMRSALVLLYEAWSLRDELQSRQLSSVQLEGNWSPVDFAPHLWRQANARLLHIEQQLLGDASASDISSAAKRLRDELVLLREAIINGQGGRNMPPLVQQWHRFVPSAEAQSLTARDGRLGEAADALRTLATALCRASWLIQWQAAEFASSPSAAQQNEVMHYLQQTGNLKRALDGLADKMATDADFDNLQFRVRELMGPAGPATLLDKSLEQLYQNALSHKERAIRERHLATLLGSPLLDADRRMRLLLELLVPLGDYPPLPEDWRLATASHTIQTARDDAAWKLTQLELELMSMYGVSDYRAASSGDTLAALREAGARLEDFYAALPAAATGTARYEALLLADVRDPTSSDAFAALTIEAVPPEAQPSLGNIDFGQLKLNEWQSVTIPIITQGITAPQISVFVEYPADVLALGEAGDRPAGASPEIRPLPAGRRVVLSPQGQDQVEWNIFVKPLTTAREDLAEGTIKFSLAVLGDVRQPVTVPVPARLPLPPDRVRLLVRREGAGDALQVADGSSLRPFPNRTTTYQFFLVNESLRPRKVQVDLFRAPKAPLQVARAPGRFLVGELVDDTVRRSMTDPQGRLRGDIVRTRKLLATSAPVELKAERNAIPITLAAPGTAASTPAAEGQPEQPPPPPPAIEPQTISDGLIAVITDVSSPEHTWIEWLEVFPLSPRNYVTATAQYANGRIVVTLTTLGRELCPSNLNAEAPISIALDASAEVPANAATSATAKLVDADQTAEVWVAAPLDDKPRRVRVDVDGVPRAFEFLVTCRPNGPVEDLRRNNTEITLHRLTAQRPPPPGTPADKPPEVDTQLVSRNRNLPNAFRTCDALLLDLKVDAPADAFETPGSQDVIEVGYGSLRHRFYHDRSSQTKLLDATGGVLVFDNVVTDLQVALDTSGQQRTISIEGHLIYRGEERDRDSVPVTLDGTAPVIERADLARNRVAKNTKLNVVVAANDGETGSGVESIAVGIDADGSGTLDDKEKLESIEHSSGSIQLDTKELKEEQKYTLLVQAVDRVGLSSKIIKKTFLVTPEVKATAEAPTKGDIVGKVLVRGVVPPNMITVSIEGNPLPPQTTTDGSFHFRNVPAGTYNLNASGTFQNGGVVGKLEGVVVPSKDPVTIVVDKPEPKE